MLIIISIITAASGCVTEPPQEPVGAKTAKAAEVELSDVAFMGFHDKYTYVQGVGVYVDTEYTSIEPLFLYYSFDSSTNCTDSVDENTILFCGRYTYRREQQGGHEYDFDENDLDVVCAPDDSNKRATLQISLIARNGSHRGGQVGTTYSRTRSYEFDLVNVPFTDSANVMTFDISGSQLSSYLQRVTGTDRAINTVDGLSNGHSLDSIESLHSLQSPQSRFRVKLIR